MDIPLIQTLSLTPLVSVSSVNLTGFDFNSAMSLFCLYLPVLIFDPIQCMPNKILCKKYSWKIRRSKQFLSVIIKIHC